MLKETFCAKTAAIPTVTHLFYLYLDFSALMPRLQSKQKTT